MTRCVSKRASIWFRATPRDDDETSAEDDDDDNDDDKEAILCMTDALSI